MSSVASGMPASSEAPESLLSIVLLGTSDAASIAESLTSALEHCAGVQQAEVCLVLHGATAAQSGLFRNLGDIRVVVAPAGMGISDAWALGLQQSQSKWTLLMSEDIRLTSGWMSPILSFMSEYPDCTAITPTITSNGKQFTTGTPDDAQRVCLIVSRAALAANRISTATPVPESHVVSTASGVARPVFAPMTPPGLATLNTEPQAPIIEAPRISHIRLAEGQATEPGYLHVTSAPIALPDDSVESISGDQFLEHVTIQSAEALISECKRVLKPGSTLRLTSLDLRVHVLNYIEQLGLRLDPAETLNAALRQVTYMYDEVDLVFRLKQAGFKKVVMRARTTGNTFIVEATK